MVSEATLARLKLFISRLGIVLLLLLLLLLLLIIIIKMEEHFYEKIYTCYSLSCRIASFYNIQLSLSRHKIQLSVSVSS